MINAIKESMQRIAVKIIVLFTLVTGYVAIPMTYNLPLGDINNELSMIWYSWFIDHIVDFNDTVNLDIASHGGIVIYSGRLVSSIRGTKATTIAKIRSEAASGAAVIAVACSKIEATPNSMLMFHKARRTSGFLDPKTEVVDNPIIDGVVTEKVFPYLFPEEKLKYNLGEDVDISVKEFLARKEFINKANKARKSK